MKRNLLERSFKQLKHEDSYVRKNAGQTIARFAPKSEIARIQFALQNESDIKVAKWLALALAKIGNPASLEAITAFLSTTTDNIERDWFLLAQAVLNKNNKKAEIKDLLKSKSVDGLKQAAQLLWAGKGDPTDELRKLITLANHADPGVRRWAVLAAGKGKMGSPDVIKDSLKDTDFLVREWTECSLTNPSLKTSPIILLPGLSDEHPRVREWAVKALAATKKPEIPEILTSHLQTEKDEECREAIYRSLASLKDVKGIPTILHSAISKKVSPAELMALIDLMMVSPKARNDIDLLDNLNNKCMESPQDFLKTYFFERLQETSTKEEQNALKLLSNSPANSFIYEKMKEGKNLEVKPKKKMKIGIVIALKEEFRVFSQIVGKLTPTDKPGYYKFNITKDSFIIEGICKLVGEKGTTRSLVATKDLISTYNPDIIINIGIAASIDRDLLLTDIVVATQVTDYFHDSKAEDSSDTWKLNLSGDSYPINYALLSKAINFEFTHPMEFSQWKSDCKQFSDETIDLNLSETLLKQNQIRKEPDAIEAKVASGPTVAASPKFVKWLKSNGDRAYKALEMESAGITAAATLADISTPVLVVRGISDFGDERKGELENMTGGSIRRVAMANATYFILYLLRKATL